MLNEKITNEQFFKKWKEVCKQNEDMLLKLSDYPTEFTNYILKVNDCIIGKIAKEFGLEHYPEYYQHDAVLCCDDDYVKCKADYSTWGKNMGYWLNRIRVAFEHENNYKSAYQEIAHLLTTKADTKILVTYVKESNLENHSKDFCKIIENLENYDTKILVIYGYNSDSKEYKWVGYELNKDGPEIIDDE